MENENKINNRSEKNKSNIDIEGIEPNIKQQNKLITYFGTGENVFSKADVPFVDYDLRMSVIAEMGVGHISQQQESDALMTITSPMDKYTPDQIFSSLESSPNLIQIKGILACFDFEPASYDIAPFKQENFKYRDNVKSDSLVSFFDKYKDPISFKNAEKLFIDSIVKENGEAKGEQYKESMRRLKMAVFGKRQEYSEQIDLLQFEANERQERINQANIILTNREKDKLGYAREFNEEDRRLFELNSNKNEAEVRRTGKGVLKSFFGSR